MYELKQVLSAASFAALGAVGKVEFEQTGDGKVAPENSARLGVSLEVRPAPRNKSGYEFGLLPQYSLRSKAIENHMATEHSYANVTPILQQH